MMGAEVSIAGVEVDASRREAQVSKCCCGKALGARGGISPHDKNLTIIFKRRRIVPTGFLKSRITHDRLLNQ